MPFLIFDFLIYIFILISNFYSYSILAFYIDYGNLPIILQFDSTDPWYFFCLQVITWRWPFVKAETCSDRREHKIKHVLLVVADEGFIL
jgi:hypothetical protein